MLPAPNLDDRRFQDLVDEAKRRIQQQCPEWTDHNVSDPGVTLVELFAWMTDLTLYRLNRVPDRHYVKYLELLDVRLFPPVAAHAAVTFWLSARQDEDLVIPAGTVVSTRRDETSDAVMFTSTQDIRVVATELVGAGTSYGGDTMVDRFAGLSVGADFACFDDEPAVDDALLIGLSAPAPGCAVVVRIECEVDGVGVDPTNPPLRWEAQVGREWVACELERDETGGLNQAGDVVLHVPDGHSAATQGGSRAAWLRCRVVAAADGQPGYTVSPRVSAMEAFTMGATGDCIHARLVEDESLGLSEGVPGQRFSLAHRPVLLTDPPPVLEILDGEGWVPWTMVSSFAESDPADRHFRLDSASGTVELGPAIRLEDGTVVQHGAVPPQGCAVRMRSYGAGGGRSGNVAAGAIKIRKSPLPFVHEVSNRRPASGGLDAEPLEEAKERGPLQLRTRNRAVTAEDFEHLAREAAPELGRVKCVRDDEAFGARLLVVARATRDGDGELDLTQLIPSDGTVERVVDHLDARRMVGTRLLVQPATLQGVTVVTTVQAAPRADRERVRRQCLDALNRYFDPLEGGPDGRGWPFGRPITVGDVYPVLGSIAGAQLVEEVLLFGADPFSGERGDEVTRIDISPTALAVSYRHTVRVREGG